MNPESSPSARPLRRGLAAALAVALLAGTAACSSDEDQSAGAPAGTPAAEAGALEPAVTVDPGPAPEVRLLEAGRGEKRVLAYSASDEPAVVAVTRSSTARTTAPGREPVTDETPEQTLTVEGMSEPDVDGAQRAAVEVRGFTSADERRAAQYATAPGFTVTWTRGADGVIRGLELEAPAEATDAARAGAELTAGAVSDATVVWPAEPVGVGARWEVTRQVTDAVAPTRVTTYELTALDGDVATVDVETTAPDAADTLEAPAEDGGPGVTLDVESYEVTGTGELTVDLRAALPVRGRLESSTEAAYTDPGRETRSTYTEESVLEFAPAD